ncbi:GIY-YIG nuclease family protein [Gammaproteobacteria bacterium]|nr:GIY-YIG nuclease family protein [Gammaproteobacteria bacterium]
MIGFIYIMSNESFKEGLLKIGMSSRHPGHFRKKELETTGVPGKFKVDYVALTQNYDLIEKAVHKDLEYCRYSKSREFFQVNLWVALASVYNQKAGKILWEEKSKGFAHERDKIYRIEEFHKDGTLRKIVSFKNLLKWGSYEKYHRNGTLMVRTNFVRGVEHGMKKVFDGKGKLLTKGHMFEGKKQGEWVSTVKHGDEKRYYDLGKKVGTWSIFGKNGDPIIENYDDPSEDYEKKIF